MSNPAIPAGPTPVGGSTRQSGPAAQVSVLIVEDDVQNLELLQAYLDGSGFRVRACLSPLVALDEIGREQPDLILLDVMMPRMSGFQLCSRLKGASSTRDIPIIMVTSIGDEGDIELAKESGADDFLRKPVSRADLLSAMSPLLQARVAKRQRFASQPIAPGNHQ